MMMTVNLRTVSILVLIPSSVTIATPFALPESTLTKSRRVFDANSETHLTQCTVRNAGDVNGDGVDDLIGVGQFASIAAVMSGADLSYLYSYEGISSADGLGDFNRDGYDDFIIGMKIQNRAQIISGFDGAILHTLLGDTATDQFGIAVSRAGDINGDGTLDFIIGASFDDNGGANSGSIRAFSGLDASIIRTFHGSIPFGELGTIISDAGDVNSDGFADVIASTPFVSTSQFGTGRVFVFSGMDGSTIYDLSGSNVQQRFGFAVSGLGDLDEDGYGDFAIGIPYNTDFPVNRGQVKIISGKTGALLRTHNGVYSNFMLGFSLGVTGDIGADTCPDYLIGAPGESSGAIRIYSPTGKLIHRFEGGKIGFSVNGVGDLNNDGFVDIATGHSGTSGSNSGATVYISAAIKKDGRCSGDADGDGTIDVNDLNAVLANWNQKCPSTIWDVSFRTGVETEMLVGGPNTSGFGSTIANLGDINGDGWNDFVVGAPGDQTFDTNSGAALVYSGADASILFEFYGSEDGDRLGNSVDCAGDINHDGINDILIGAPGITDGSGSGGGVFVYSGSNGELLLSAFSEYPGDGFGSLCRNTGDVNSDSYDDFLLGASRSDVNGLGSGSAYVISGFDGSRLFSMHGHNAGDRFGISVCKAGDYNSDGHADFMVSAPYEDVLFNNAGAVYIYSGFDGSVLYFRSGSVGALLGSSIAYAGDTNNDGLSDTIIGSPSYDGTFANEGAFVVHAGGGAPGGFGQTGDWPQASLGELVGSVGRFNDDANDDVIVRAPALVGTGARVYSGANGALLLEIGSTAFSTFCSLGDSDQDGFDDFLYGISGSGVGGASGGSIILVRNLLISPWSGCVGNTNGDDRVDIDDLNVVLSNWNTLCD